MVQYFNGTNYSDRFNVKDTAFAYLQAGLGDGFIPAYDVKLV